jgi:hypothetical protein
MREWWNWQTHHLEGVAPKGVGVQIPPPAPIYLAPLHPVNSELKYSCTYFLSNGAIHNNIGFVAHAACTYNVIVPRKLPVRPKRRTRILIIVSTFNLGPALCDRLERDGWDVVLSFVKDIQSADDIFPGLLKRWRPAAVVYEVASPHEEDWRLAERLRRLPQCQIIPFVICTVSRAAPQVNRGRTGIVELPDIGDAGVDLISKAVRAVTARSSRPQKKIE